jgi:DNA-binding beta-propeller fold protein YncE
MRKRRFLLKSVLSLSLLLALLFSLSGQGLNPNILSQEDAKYTIRWVSQYPAIKAKTKEHNNGISVTPSEEHSKERTGKQLKNRITDLIFGEKTSKPIKPMSIIAINPDTFWIVDQGIGSILEVFNGVGEMTHIRNKKLETLPSLVSSCLLPGNKILFTDSKLNKVFVLIPGSKEYKILNDSLILDQPTGIAYSAVNKEIWVVETKAHRISVLNEEGILIKQIGSRGSSPGEFNFPTYIWIDKSGTVFVVDAMNFRIQIFSENGELLSVFGEIGDSSGYLSRPKGIATDSYGHIYVADALFHVVQVFDNRGKFLYVFGSQGQEKEQFWMPTGIFIDHSNYIYIADSYNSRIQVYQLIHEN